MAQPQPGMTGSVGLNLPLVIPDQHWRALVPQLLTAKAFDDVARVLAKAAVLEPRSPDPSYWEAVLCLTDPTRSAGALEAAQRAVEAGPRRPELHWTLGRALKAQGDIPGAVVAYRRALELKPDYAEAWVSLGLALKAGRDFDEAIRCFERALAAKPGLAVAHANLGTALQERALWRKNQPADATDPGARGTGEIAQAALEAQRRAATIAPNDAGVLAVLGKSLETEGRYEEAIGVLARAFELERKREDVCLSLASCFFRVARIEAALQCYERWLETNPVTPMVAGNYAITLGEASQAEKSLEWAQRALDLDPRLGVGNQAMAAAALRVGDSHGVVDFCRKALERGINGTSLWSVLAFATNYVETDPEIIFNEHRELGAASLRVVQLLPAFDDLQKPDAFAVRAKRPASRKLRVGLSSADFRQHSVAYFIEPLIEHLDRKGVELYFYHNAPFADRITERLKRHAAGWAESQMLPDARFAQRVRDDGVDVLVDLSGHTVGQRIKALAARMAPAQISYLGYPTTTGVPTVDFRLSDPVIDPADEPSWNVERVLLFPQTMFCYRPPQDAPTPGLRHDADEIVLGSFNSMVKVTRPCVALWAEVLRAYPRTRLALKGAALAFPLARDRILGFFAAEGIDGERLLLDRWEDQVAHHLERYNAIDIALDTFPYNGATTTCEALWMGVPVVSLAGATHVSRMGASILSAVGLERWLVHSKEDFVARVGQLIEARDSRHQFRKEARDLMRASALLDEAQQGESFERMLYQSWEAVRG